MIWPARCREHQRQIIGLSRELARRVHPRCVLAAAAMSHMWSNLTPGQKQRLDAAEERSKRRKGPMSTRAKSAPPSRSGQKSVVLSTSPLRMREERSKDSRRCGRLPAGARAEVLQVEGTRAEIRLPGSRDGVTGWVTIEKPDGRVLLGRDFDLEGHLERMAPHGSAAGSAIGQVLERLDPRNAENEIARNAEKRRVRDKWKSRQEEEAVNMLNKLSIKQQEKQEKQEAAKREEEAASASAIAIK